MASRISASLCAAVLWGTAALLVAASPSSAQGTCLLYPSGSAVPSGYGASWDVFSPGRELLITTDCPAAGSTLSLRVGRGDPNQLVYNLAYSYTGTWNPHTLAGTVSTGTWLSGLGTASIPSPATATAAAPMYIVGYTCSLQSSAWKCGCADTACASGKWQLQAYGPAAGTAATTGTTATGGVTTTGGTTGTTCGSTWADFNDRSFSIAVNSSVAGKLGVTESDLANVIANRTGTALATARTEARSILNRASTLSDLNLSKPLVVEEGTGLTVKYSGKVIMRVARETSSSVSYRWDPVSFSQLPAADRPNASGVDHVIETVIRHNFRSSGLNAFEARASLIGCGS